MTKGATMPEPIRLHDTAFPLQGFAVDASGAFSNQLILARGLSKREWFAAMALCGLMSDPEIDTDVAARMAIDAADSMMKALK